MFPGIDGQIQAGAGARSGGEKFLSALDVSECDLQADHALEELRHTVFVSDLADAVQAVVQHRTRLGTIFTAHVQEAEVQADRANPLAVVHLGETAPASLQVHRRGVVVALPKGQLSERKVRAGGTTSVARVLKNGHALTQSGL